jgi:type IV secretory pathway TraG/TraD family ATPase VirD4
MILGIHSFEKLIEVYGEQGARNLASLARSKLILATADLDTAEQCARYIGNREVRQMDEAYSYGYNNTRDASTLTQETGRAARDRGRHHEPAVDARLCEVPRRLPRRAHPTRLE